MQEFMDRWAVRLAGVVLLAILIAVIIGFQPTRSMVCVGDGNCLQGWVSALSGWAAVAAALITVQAMNRQILAANRQHRESMQIQILGRIAVAKRAINYRAVVSQRYFLVSTAYETIVSRSIMLDAPAVVQKFRDELLALQKDITDDAVNQFEELIGAGEAYGERQRALVEIAKGVLLCEAHMEELPRVRQYSPDIFELRRHNIAAAGDTAVNCGRAYLDHILLRANAFLVKPSVLWEQDLKAGNSTL